MMCGPEGSNVGLHAGGREAGDTTAEGKAWWPCAKQQGAVCSTQVCYGVCSVGRVDAAKASQPEAGCFTFQHR